MIQRPANEVWVDDPAPGGWICGVCLYPVESEPCEQHDGAALTDEQLAWLATEPSDTHQPHATTTAWMRAAR